MELFTQLFGTLLVFVYHCFDRIVIHGYLSGLSRPEQVVYFFRQVVGVKAVDKEVLSQRTNDYQRWVEAFARNHDSPIEWGEKGVRKEDHVLPWQRATAVAACNFTIHVLGDVPSPPLLGALSDAASLQSAVLLVPVAFLVGGAIWTWGALTGRRA